MARVWGVSVDRRGFVSPISTDGHQMASDGSGEARLKPAQARRHFPSLGLWAWGELLVQLGYLRDGPAYFANYCRGLGHGKGGRKPLLRAGSRKLPS
jgi:hypothetical protein